MDFLTYIVFASLALISAYFLGAYKFNKAAIALVIFVCIMSPADASEEFDAIDVSDSWIDFSDFGLPTVFEPLKGKTKIFMGEAYSTHFDKSYDYNEVHENYGFEYKISDKWAINITTFENSYFERSNSLAIVYAWKHYEPNNSIRFTAGIQGGVADGYEKAKYNAGGFAPIIAPYVDIVAFQSVGMRASIWNAYVANIAFYVEF
ncbi:TMhelix containing protein [Vibrio phage 1.141.A._10N.261.49.B3]|uniref:TMhelix containing protein n=1 Tax=Vibrio phage 1.141.A._10N.261.49.B3 TaxID=1881286 RepID=A0A2I7R9I7_9VIRU|nr:TMhelix containing protein [Vibrio phage 1.141.A._10N.261.49.B3]